MNGRFFRLSAPIWDVIMDSAHENGAEFVLHCGDFIKSWPVSPEITGACLNNKYQLSVSLPVIRCGARAVSQDE